MAGGAMNVGADSFLVAAAVVFGAVAGSFLNAVIHRLPRGIGLGHPRRSFCPACGVTIPWSRNLPVASWLALRGRCADCGAGISFRYPLVEVLTAVLFGLVWWRFDWPLAAVYSVFLCLLVAATFIDFEHFIIPDSITLGGTMAGVVLSLLVPAATGGVSPWGGLGWSIAGAVCGFAILFLVVEGGKIAFGRIRHRFDPAEEFHWSGATERLRLGDEDLAWDDLFARRRDVLAIELEGVARIDGEDVAAERLEFRYDRVEAGGRVWDLGRVGEVAGRMRAVVIPREAMGFGDVKFLACIGAFTGWQGAVFALFAGSIIGSFAGLAGLFLARDRAGVRLPFGPFLAAGALVWLFAGRGIVNSYFEWLGRPAGLGW
jgi:leader peptidase (prepilin peptidase) / N-methyltransferase